MDSLISISYLNDFIFCPASIYYHQLFQGQNSENFDDTPQALGKAVHQNIDEQSYSTSSKILQGIWVGSSELGLIGRIDLYDLKSEHLIERKRRIKQIFDGYIFQVYGQFYCLEEMGYPVKKISIRSFVDNKVYPIRLPTEDPEMSARFFRLIESIRLFSLKDFKQENPTKCERCNYATVCDRVRYVE